MGALAKPAAVDKMTGANPETSCRAGPDRLGFAGLPPRAEADLGRLRPF